MRVDTVSAAEIAAHPHQSLLAQDYLPSKEPSVRQVINDLKALKRRPPAVENAIKFLELFSKVTLLLASSRTKSSG